MPDKFTVLCADHLCIHNSCSGYYGICALSALTVGTYAGIDRSYVNTCHKREAIPGCVARGPGKIAVFYRGFAGSNKSTIELKKALDTAIAFSLGETELITKDDVMSAIQQLQATKPETTPWSASPFQFDAKFSWDRQEEED